MTGLVVKLGAFIVAALTVLAGLAVVFGQWRFDDYTPYRALFDNASGLEAGDVIRVAGVEMGKVSSVEIVDNELALVEMDVVSSYPITEGTTATVRYANLVGDRFLQLASGAGGTSRLAEGETIPRERTHPALDLDALLGSFKPLFRAMDATQVNQLTGELIAVLQGQGGTVESILTRAASLTGTLADRDQLVGQVIDNLQSVLATLAARHGELDSGIDQLQQLVSGLSAERDPLAGALDHINDATATVADLLIGTRPSLQGTVTELGRTAVQLDAGSDTIGSVVSRLPDTYAALSRLGAYGNFFNYYLCGITITLNGADGEPFTTPVLGQTTGRCAPQS
ncbi:MAG: MCE family protein [Rhodococcus sp. (in: high G+C Gram-positive bacteria)]|uniref:MCE family protein n=1 Tax=Rhodococcus sp. TaxID=1831 RepID=UPI003BAE94D1